MEAGLGGGRVYGAACIRWQYLGEGTRSVPTLSDLLGQIHVLGGGSSPAGSLALRDVGLRRGSGWDWSLWASLPQPLPSVHRLAVLGKEPLCSGFVALALPRPEIAGPSRRCTGAQGAGVWGGLRVGDPHMGRALKAVKPRRRRKVGRGSPKDQLRGPLP